MEKIDRDVVFFTDKIVEKKQFNITRRDAEGNSREIAYELKDALSSFCNSVIMFDTIEPFLNSIDEFKHYIIFSTYYGVAHRSSKALIPAICEANHLQYVGADSYTHMICNDKYLSKKYISDFGIKSAPAVLIRNPNDPQQLQLIRNLKLPIIIKPNYGGGSTGITSENLKLTYSEAIDFIKLLYGYQNQPILVEEYISGNELEVILFGNNNDIIIFDEILIEINGKSYFENEIFDLASKKVNDENVELYQTALLSKNDIEKFKKMFKSFPKIEFMRIDCRINAGDVHVIELSPDCYLGADGGVSMAFGHCGYSQQEMLRMMIENSLLYFSSLN